MPIYFLVISSLCMLLHINKALLKFKLYPQIKIIWVYYSLVASTVNLKYGTKVLCFYLGSSASLNWL